MVRTADKKSPREAVEFVLQLLKYNDNNGNPYSDVFWLAALIQSVGELEFGQQNILFLPSLLKRIDRLLQFDRLMPSYNGILTVSCIRTLTQIALKLSGIIPLDRAYALIKPFCDLKTTWQVRIEASRALIDLEFYSKGIDAALLLFIEYLGEELSLRGQVKLCIHAMRLSQMSDASASDGNVKSQTLVALLRLLESRMAFNNVFLRHYLFCILQVLARRPPTLHGVPRDQLFHMGRTSLVAETKPPDLPVETPNISRDNLPNLPEPSKDADNISNSHERRTTVVKLRVKQSATSSRAEEADNRTHEKSQGGGSGPHNETDRAGGSSSNSVDAPPPRTQILEEVNSFHDRDRLTSSIGSVKLASEKELQCTADSSKTMVLSLPDSQPSPSFIQDNNSVDAGAQKFASLQILSVVGSLASMDSQVKKEKEKEKKKDKEKKRKRDKDDPGYLEKKRLKKEKKQKEKEMAKLLETKMDIKPSSVEGNEPGGSKVVVTKAAEASEASSAPKFRIKIKNLTLNKS